MIDQTYQVSDLKKMELRPQPITKAVTKSSQNP